MLTSGGLSLRKALDNQMQSEYLLQELDISLFRFTPITGHESVLCGTAYVLSSYRAVSLLLNVSQNMFGRLYVGACDYKATLPLCKENEH